MCGIVPAIPSVRRGKPACPENYTCAVIDGVTVYYSAEAAEYFKSIRIKVDGFWIFKILGAKGYR